jgi:hypothetical protein
MDDPRAQRTLVKSPPELWAEVSDVGALARHLGAFGGIRITRLEPESTVAWEGDRARGTVELEPSGWGTRVTLTARIEAGPRPADDAAPDGRHATQTGAEAMATPELEAVAEPAPAPPVAEPQATPEARPAQRRGLLAWLLGRRRQRDAPVAPSAPSAPAAGYEAAPAAQTERALEAAVERAPDTTADAAPDHASGAEQPIGEEPAPLDAGRAEEILTGVLDDLGAARHRPFSRG